MHQTPISIANDDHVKLFDVTAVAVLHLPHSTGMQMKAGFHVKSTDTHVSEE